MTTPLRLGWFSCVCWEIDGLVAHSGTLERGGGCAPAAVVGYEGIRFSSTSSTIIRPHGHRFTNFSRTQKASKRSRCLAAAGGI